MEASDRIAAADRYSALELDAELGLPHTSSMSDDLLPPRLGTALACVYLTGPANALEPAERLRPFRGVLVRWLRRAALLDDEGLEDPAEPTEVEGLLVQLRDMETADPRAIPALKAALAYAERTGDALGVAMVRWRWAGEATNARDLDVARTVVQPLMGHDHPGVQSLGLALLATVAIQQGLPAVALRHVDRALTVVRPPSYAVGFAHQVRGMILGWQQADPEESLLAAVDAFRAVGAHARAAYTLAMLARHQVERGQPERALATVWEAPPLTGMLGASMLQTEGRALLELGRLVEAHEAWSKSLELAQGREAQFVLLAEAGRTITGALSESPVAPVATIDQSRLRSTPEYDLALARVWASGDALPPEWSRWAEVHSYPVGARRALGMAAAAALERGELEEAEDLLGRAQELADRSDVGARCRGERARAQIAMVRGEPAYEALEALAEMHRKRADRLGQAIDLALAAESLWVHGHVTRAIRALRHALSLAHAIGLRRGVARWEDLLELCEGQRSKRVGPLRPILDAVHGQDPWPVSIAALEAELNLRPEGRRRRDLEVAKASLRRQGVVWSPSAGPTLVIQTKPAECWLGGQRVCSFGRARTQVALLVACAERPDVTREELFVHAWEQPYRPPSSDNTLHVNLTRLRKRLGHMVELRTTEHGGVQLPPGMGFATCPARRP